MTTRRNKKPICPVCHGKIELIVHRVGGYDSSISANGMAFTGVNDFYIYRCSHWSDICKLTYDLYRLYTNKELRSRKSWRDALGRYHDFVEFCIDNELLVRKIRGNSNEFGEISIEMRDMYLKPAIKISRSL